MHPRVHFVFDNRHPFGGSHHEKIFIVDGVKALCGGIDICDDRWDEPQHLYSDPRRSLDGLRERHGPYHDIAVQVTGPVCHEIQEHVGRRWRAISSISFPSPPQTHSKSDSGYQVYLSRTVAKIHPSPFESPVVREVEFLFRDLIQAAKSRIILEGQYYWSEQMNDMLISKVLAMRGKPFEVFLILADLRFAESFSKQMMVHEFRLLSKLRTAANYAGVRLFMGSPIVFANPSQSRPLGLELECCPPPKAVYIHSKVLIVDDRYLAIGSTHCHTSFSDRYRASSHSGSSE